MRILHLIAGNLSGGAARGAYWLHRGLKNIGVESKVLTNSVDTLGDSDVATIAISKINKLQTKIYSHLEGVTTWGYRNRKNIIFSTGFWGKAFLKNNLIKWADIIHLHWINAGFINIKYIHHINKPIVWTMRDMWPMTGGCHVAKALNCLRYESGCGKCPQLGSRHSYDLSKIILLRKKKYLPNNMKIVGISRWLSECAQKSWLFQNFDVRTISNNVDCSQFFPIDKKIARSILGINQDCKIILAGATNLNDFYKGFDKLIESINFLTIKNIHLLFFGRLSKDSIKYLKYPYTDLGFLHDTVSLRLAYSAADVFVAPSLMDAFGKTLAESMACATPVVCFNATGPKDIVDHKKNGYRAQPFEPEDLAHGIEWILEDYEWNKALCEKAREKIEANFDIHIIAQKYKELYQEIQKP
ncbi:Group 1 glycosyl transferase [Candidatus Magnetomoraceae bacterium gMMP-1]